MPELRIALLFAVLSILGCGSEKTLPTQPGGDGGEGPIPFSRIQNELFSVNCALSGCHVQPDPTGEMALESGIAYDNIVNVPSSEIPGLDRIEPFEPELSYMVKKLRGDPDIVGAPMPRTGEITEAQFELLVSWIEQGAPR